MFQITAVTSRLESTLMLEDEQEAQALYGKVHAQMNNNETVTFGQTLINPKHLHAIEFKKMPGEEA